MSNKIDELIGTGVIEKTKADYIKEKFQDFTQAIEEWSEKASAIVVSDETQKELMAEAREGRLLLKAKRIEVEKVRISLKEQSLNEGRLIDSVAKYLTGLIEPAEKHLELQEKFVQIQEQNKRIKLKAERTAELMPYREVINPNDLQLDLMTDEAFSTILNGAKIALQTKKDEAERLEKEALENKRKEKLFQERRLQIVEYKKYYNAETDLILNLETSETDFKSLLNSLIQRHEEEVVKQKNIEKENEKLKQQNIDNKKQIKELKTIIKIEKTPTSETPTTIIKKDLADKDTFGVDSSEEFISVKKRDYEILKTRYGIAKTALESVLYFIVPVNLRDLVNNAMRDIADAEKE